MIADNEKYIELLIKRYKQQSQDYLQQFLQDFINREEVSCDLIAQAIMVQMCRPGWPGYYLNQISKDKITKIISDLSSSIVFFNDYNAIAIFSQRCLQLFFDNISAAKIKLLCCSNLNKKNQKIFFANKLKKEVISHGEYTQNYKKLAIDIVKQRKKHRAIMRKQKMLQNDPLAKIVNLPMDFIDQIPKNDIRHHMLFGHLSKKEDDSAFFNLLRQAAPFHESTIKAALGPELFGLCQPVGFFDKKQKTILIKVSSPYISQRLHYQKEKILMRLKTIPQFKNVVNIRFKVSVD